MTRTEKKYEIVSISRGQLRYGLLNHLFTQACVLASESVLV